MKFPHKWLSPLLMAIFASCSIWLITDIASEVKFWKLEWPYLLDRIEAFILIMICSLTLN